LSRRLDGRSVSSSCCGARARGLAVSLLAAACVASANAFAQVEELVYHARAGDTLIGISERMLEKPRDWPKLQARNRIDNPRRIPIGREIRIPVAWLRQVPAIASVVAVHGTAHQAGQKLESGSVLPEGAEIDTGPDGYVTIQLADGSVLTLQSESRLALQRMKRYSESDAYDSQLQLPSGRVETRAQRKRRVGRFEIHNPVAISAVRGTDFRVSFDPSAAVGRAEALAGAVAVSGGEAGPPAARSRTARASMEVVLEPGFGTLVDATRVPRPPTPLPAPPDLSKQPALQERVLFRFRFEPVSGASGYRGQIALEEEFRRVVAEAVFSSPEARFADLPDARYTLRVRSIDALGIEGADAMHSFILKARPEPPFPSYPPDKGKQTGERAAFQWTAAGADVSYRFQLARDAEFQDLIDDRSDISAPQAAVESVQPGEYYWRVATTARDGDRGPFGDPQRYTQKPTPAVPDPPEMDEASVTLTWASEPGQTFRLQLARDPEFRDVVADQQLSEPRIALPKPPPGTYYVRVQATDADGYVGPFTAPQSFAVPTPPPPWWVFPLLVIPFLL
jgi:hypothetical protein